MEGLRMFGWFKSKAKPGHNTVAPITALSEAIRLIEEFEGLPTDFALAIDDSLNDIVGVNMALITDKILQRGWEPNGFIQGPGYRTYLYKELL
jgi:hypothetical protein